MGQKVNPNLFRIGLSRGYVSDWFFRRVSYGGLLEEDYRVRSFFKERLLPFAEKSGVTTLHIRRGAGGARLEVTLFAERPEAALALPPRYARKIRGKQTLAVYLRSRSGELRKFLRRSAWLRTCRLKIRRRASRIETSSAVALALGRSLQFRVNCGRALRGTVEDLKYRGAVEGVKLQVSGRLSGNRRARRMGLRDGRVPLHTISADIEYAVHHVETRNGIVGVKVWLFRGSEALLGSKGGRKGRKP
jgi:small subunit ribosomal protein S3